MNKFTDKQVINYLNLTMQQQSIPQKLGAAYKKLDLKSPSFKQDYQIQMGLLDNNFLMKNLPNVIVSQRYHNNLQKLLTGDFNFWFLPDGQGHQEIIEDALITSERIGSALADLPIISPEALSEVQVLEFGLNTAADIKTNINIQKWATLPGLVSWLNERLENLNKSIDIVLHKFLKEQIELYPNYYEIIIDSTGLSADEIAKEMEKQIQLSMEKLTNDHTNIYNEQVNGINFKSVYEKSSIGIILSDKASVNREINYLRQQVNMGDTKDFGAGEIITKPLDTLPENSAILLPKQKFIWSKEEMSGTTSFAYSYHELTTNGVFYGNIFMKSVPAIKITAEVITPFNSKHKFIKSRIENEKKQMIDLIDRNIKLVQKHKFDDENQKLKAITLLNKQKEQIANLDASKKASGIKIIRPNKSIAINKTNNPSEYSNYSYADDLKQENKELNKEIKVDKKDYNQLLKIAKESGLVFPTKPKKEDLLKQIELHNAAIKESVEI